MQKSDISIIAFVESVETTRWNYKQLLQEFCKNENNVFEILPTMKDIINIIEENKDGEPTYHGQWVKRYLQEKQYIKNCAVEIVEKILACSEQQFSSVYREDAQPFNKVADDRDNFIFDVCMILNTTVWPKLDDNTDDEFVLEKQLSAVKRVYQRCIYYRQKAFVAVTEEERINNFIDIVRYANQYFNN